MKKVLIALMLTACMTTAGFAAKGTTSLSVLAGYAVPISGDWNDMVKGSMNAAVAGDYQFHDMFAAGLEIGYNFKHEAEVGDAEVKVLYVAPYGKFLHKKDKMTFYGIFGFGWYQSKAEITILTVTTSTTESDLGINLGGGIMFDVAENMQLGGEVRWHHVFVEDMAVNNIVPAVKFSYLFN